MLEYVFFHQQPFNMFLEYLESKELKPVIKQGDDVFEIALPDDLDDDLSDEIDEEYDRLFELNQQLMDTPDTEEKAYSKVAIEVTLSNGSISPAFVEPNLMNKILGVLTIKELDMIVKAIVTAVENPDSRSFCTRVIDGDEL